VGAPYDGVAVVDGSCVVVTSAGNLEGSVGVLTRLQGCPLLKH
jgi:hypothetical protein